MFRAGDLGGVRTICHGVLQTSKKNPHAWHLLAAVALKEERFEDAEALVMQAIAFGQPNPYYFNTLGVVRRAKGDFESAVAAFRQALRLDPHLHAALRGLGACLRAQGDLRASIYYLDRLVGTNPDDVDALCELAITGRDAGELDLALRHLHAGLRLQPSHQRARSILAKALLLAGNFRDGWAEYLRSLTNSAQLPEPGMCEHPFEGKHVVVYGHEGAGDEIMAAGCIPELLAQAAGCTLHADERLVPLFQRSFAQVSCLAMQKKGTTVHIGTPNPREVHLLGTMLYPYLRANPNSLPPRHAYLTSDAGKIAKWRQRYQALGPGLNIGLSWRAGVDFESRRQRSIPLSSWGAVLRLQGANFVSLQYGDVATELEGAPEQTGVTIHDWPDTDPLADLDDFAAQVAALDLVVSVDNTTVHMAGALGVPVGTLLPFAPNWRWGLEGAATHWYSSMVLLRQKKPGEWESVLDDARTWILGEIEKRLNRRHPTGPP